MDSIQLKPILEAALLASSQPLTQLQLEALFAEDEANPVSRTDIATALEALADDCAGRGIELVEVASGFRYQIRKDVHPWVQRLWTERPSRYSRALLETLALIAYRQPITRGEIEQVRGVAVSSNITKTLEEREWIRVVGHRDTPGRPALFGTTRLFLDYFNLKSLDELPPLADILNLEEIDPQLALDDAVPAAANVAPPSAATPDDADFATEAGPGTEADTKSASTGATTPDTDAVASTIVTAAADDEPSPHSTPIDSADATTEAAAETPVTTGAQNPEENRA
ncbi:MAG TPA: SMC-Scp complex subunit ScpB [Rhodanobacteraceae bacterium]